MLRNPYDAPRTKQRKPPYEPQPLVVGRMVEEPKSGKVGHVVKLEGTTAIVRFHDGARPFHQRQLVLIPTQAEISAGCAKFRRAAGLPDVVDDVE